MGWWHRGVTFGRGMRGREGRATVRAHHTSNTPVRATRRHCVRRTGGLRIYIALLSCFSIRRASFLSSAAISITRFSVMRLEMVDTDNAAKAIPD